MTTTDCMTSRGGGSVLNMIKRTLLASALLVSSSLALGACVVAARPGPVTYAPYGYNTAYTPNTVYYQGGYYSGTYYRPGYYYRNAPFITTTVAAPVYQQPVYQQPVYQAAPVYQQPVYGGGATVITNAPPPVYRAPTVGVGVGAGGGVGVGGVGVSGGVRVGVPVP